VTTRTVTLFTPATPPVPLDLTAQNPFQLPTVQELVDLMRRVRALQLFYRRTLDSRTRREMEQLEHALDVKLTFASHDIAAEKARQASEDATIAAAGDPANYGPKTVVPPPRTSEGGAA
jgi:hypothetical protein